MNKVKLKMNAAEMKAVVVILENINFNGHFNRLEGKASRVLLKKLYFSLLAKLDNLKADKNTLTLSFPEAWAMVYQVNKMDGISGIFEQNIYLKVWTEINKQCV